MTVDPPSCLESGVNYSIRIDFNRYKSDQSTPDATALIDSVRMSLYIYITLYFLLKLYHVQFSDSIVQFLTILCSFL